MARNHLKGQDVPEPCQPQPSLRCDLTACPKSWSTPGMCPFSRYGCSRGLVRELQALISHDVCEYMHDIEERNCFEFDKTRIA